MFKLLRHPSQTLRAWLLVAAAVLLLTSVIEAGHAHGVVTPDNDHCVLCQHSVPFDQALATAAISLFLVLPVAMVAALAVCFCPQSTRSFALIRAPPA